jgi:hypothetical protein
MRQKADIEREGRPDGSNNGRVYGVQRNMVHSLHTLWDDPYASEQHSLIAKIRTSEDSVSEIKIGTVPRGGTLHQ